jgi:hypothetical protein
MEGLGAGMRERLDEMTVARPVGVSALTAFFAFGMTMSGLAAVSLALPGSVLEPMWRLNPHGHDGLAALGLPGVVLMAIVSMACLGAAAGLWLGRRWGRGLAMAILVINAVGDMLNGTLGNDRRALIGVPIAAALLYYLRTARVRAFFDAGERDDS